MKTLIGVVLGGCMVFAGYRLARSNTPTTNSIAQVTASAIYCGHIETEQDEDDAFDIEYEPCTNRIAVVLGGTGLCDDHFDTYLADMFARDKHKED